MLYTSGFFADHLSTRGVELRYVRTLGARAYDGLASMLRQSAGDGTGALDVYRELADKLRDVRRGRGARGRRVECELGVQLESANGALVRALGKNRFGAARCRLGRQRAHPAAWTRRAALTARQRELRRIQRELEAFYGLERAPNVNRFVRDGDQGSREVVLVRETNDELEMALVLPPESQQIALGGALDDVWLQVAEGVSNFIYLVERARVSLPVTKLELELQAEVDKFVLSLSFSADSAQRLVQRPFDAPRFLDAEDTEDGARYRLAHQLAARFVSRAFVANDRGRARERLRTFYRAGQAEKIHLASAD